MEKHDQEDMREMVAGEMTREDIFILIKHNRLSFEEFNEWCQNQIQKTLYDDPNHLS